MEKVAVKKCSAYNHNIYEYIKKLVDAIGGIESYVNDGDRVVLKVNLLMGKSPDSAVTTHPEIVRAVARLVKDVGGNPVIADSPGGPFNNLNLKQGYRAAGFADIAREDNIKLNYDTDEVVMKFEKGKIKKSFKIANYIKEADVIINLPKLKTHGLTMYTGAVKNLFGVIPGLLKAEYHLNLEQADLFSEMLVDLAELVKPDLTIMDGIMGMEGDGPSGGEVKNFSYLFVSNSPFSIDVVGTYIMGIEPQEEVPTIKAQKIRNIVADISEIELIGDKVEPVMDTQIPEIEKTSNLIDQKIPEPLSNIIAYFLRPRPVFDKKVCVGCGDCIRSCPANTIELKNGKAEVDLKDCIRCFCCQEVCRYQAVDIKRPLLGKLIFG